MYETMRKEVAFSPWGEVTLLPRYHTAREEERVVGPEVPIEGLDPTQFELTNCFRTSEHVTGWELQRRAVEELHSPYGRHYATYLERKVHFEPYPQPFLPQEWKRYTIMFLGDYDLDDLTCDGYRPCAFCLHYDDFRWLLGTLRLDAYYSDVSNSHLRVLTPRST